MPTARRFMEKTNLISAPCVDEAYFLQLLPQVLATAAVLEPFRRRRTSRDDSVTVKRSRTKRRLSNVWIKGTSSHNKREVQLSL